MIDPLQVVHAALEQVRRQVRRLLADLARGDGRRGTRGRCAPTGVGTQAIWRRIGIAVLDLDILDGQAKLLGHDLGERGLVALALGPDADAHDGRTRRVDPNLGAIEHLDAQDVESVRGTGADDLGERR